MTGKMYFTLKYSIYSTYQKTESVKKKYVYLELERTWGK